MTAMIRHLTMIRMVGIATEGMDIVIAMSDMVAAVAARAVHHPDAAVLEEAAEAIKPNQIAIAQELLAPIFVM